MTDKDKWEATINGEIIGMFKGERVRFLGNIDSAVQHFSSTLQRIDKLEKQLSDYKNLKYRIRQQIKLAKKLFMLVGKEDIGEKGWPTWNE